MNPPTDLRTDGLALFKAVDGLLDELSKDLDPHEVALLVEACRVADRLAQLRDAIDGADWSDAAITRLLSEERQQRLALGTLLVSKLGLPTGLAGPGESPVSRQKSGAARQRWINRTPGEASESARKASVARWSNRGA